jgi:hypothetical protein
VRFKYGKAHTAVKWNGVKDGRGQVGPWNPKAQLKELLLDFGWRVGNKPKSRLYGSL